MSSQVVLVTGGSGFIATHCILQLLKAGYKVRTTVRSLSREAEVRAMLKVGGVEPGDSLAFVAADLSVDEGWTDAAAGCTYVLHPASPTPSGQYATEEDWIKPARDGVLRVLRASRDTGVKRVVLTSAFGAVGCGHINALGRPFDETDWSNLDGNLAPYQRSKTLSEQAAWDFISREGGALELAVINPVAVMGPVFGPDYSHSIQMIKRFIDGMSGCPKINSGYVDVRDVADLHLRAMTHPDAKGERFIAISGSSLWMLDIAIMLREILGKGGDKVPTRELPNFLLKLAAWRDPKLKGIVPLLGVNMDSTSAKAMRVLSWHPRSVKDSLTDTLESLKRLDLL